MKAENREQQIWESMWKHYTKAMQTGSEIFAVCLQGSQNYNIDLYTPQYTSDVDTKAIVLPSVDQFIRNGKAVNEVILRGDCDEHIDMKDIRIMFETFKKQNVNFVEILFTDYFIVPSKWDREWKQLKELAERLVHAHPAQTVRTMAGMSYEKKKALCHPYPSIVHKIEKWGYDGKQLHHIIRINDFLKRYISGLSFKEAMQPSEEIRYMLVKAKLNEYSLDEAKELAEFYDNENARLKNEYIEKVGEGIKDPEAYNLLNDLQAQILKKHLKEKLLEE